MKPRMCEPKRWSGCGAEHTNLGDHISLRITRRQEEGRYQRVKQNFLGFLVGEGFQVGDHCTFHEILRGPAVRASTHDRLHDLRQQRRHQGGGEDLKHNEGNE